MIDIIGLKEMQSKGYNCEYDYDDYDTVEISEYELNNMVLNKNVTIIFTINTRNNSIYWNTTNNKRIVKIKLIQK